MSRSLQGLLEAGYADPCLSCPLDTCTPKSRRCPLRRALRSYDYAKRTGKPVSEELRLTCNLAWNEFYAARRNERRRLQTGQGTSP